MPDIFLEAQSTELFMSLYPYNYGAFFSTQMRLQSFLKDNPDANVFPLIMDGRMVQHRLFWPTMRTGICRSMRLTLLRLRRRSLTAFPESVLCREGLPAWRPFSAIHR